MRAAKVQASLRIRAVSPEPSLLAHTSSESRGTFRQKARSLAPVNGWACAVKICHDGMLEDTNSLEVAQLKWRVAFASNEIICMRWDRTLYCIPRKHRACISPKISHRAISHQPSDWPLSDRASPHPKVSKNISTDQELIQSDPISCSHIKRERTKYINWQQFTKGTRGKPNEQPFPRQVVIQLHKSPG